ncbi:hypothetical protein Ais01nite_82400 [Asanoa ishikariensis]|uniref:Uncharacterized protein n=1 Tax=Asanoa ishikariensis TaxID=137265 RepID=A0A1H3SC89_9ACTN|nr:hypothetical protein [Asanoa ishikariensis]GIF70205.1 hypothetical protein Ais01nite_82400 [Asanoa ishikariensis]SDZ35310.1 hypothetical protein SAMN05421684_4798 [Asanoa ishikariensis]
MTPTDNPRPKRVATRMPTPAAVLGALAIAMAGLLVVFVPLVSFGADGILALVIGAGVGLAAGATFFVIWWRRAPKRRRRTR